MVKKDEDKIYNNILVVTGELKKLELKVAIYTFICSLIFFLLYFLLNKLSILYLISVIFFGIGITILFRRNEDIRLGGILTYPLLLYYTLSNALLPIHFLLVVAIGIPITIYLVRRGYLGQVLFYTLAIFIFPLTVLSYYVLSSYFRPVLLSSIAFDPGYVIYLLLPHIYLYNLMKLPKEKIMNDITILILLIIGGVGFWLLLNLLTGI